ncbi:MAG: DNA polymerase III subunit gamma/tau [Oligoflexia bacterium]|nr:DNA polymerase III subunit gamma/tau [Oligoflexia bacterium]
MAYQVLSRKWRPKKFQDVVGQEHVTRSLQNAILKERLGHAYILTGTRGIGKTSIARIFGKSLRCSNRLEDGNACNECDSCLEFDNGNSLNVVEIDGASNNSVDDVRELINKVHTLPSSGQYKIYIIDEVHMLTTSAFNALLKTLEEPPEHVIFILATTEPHKLLNTVLSRCQRFDLRNATIESLVDHLRNVSKAEGITFESDELIKVICEQGKGSFRDTLSLMDQVLSFSSNNVIDNETVSISLGLAKTSAVDNLILSMLCGEAKETSNHLRSIFSENVSLENCYIAITDRLFNIIENIDDLSSITISSSLVEALGQMDFSEIFWVYETLVKDYEWIKNTVNADKVFEVCLRKITSRRDILAAKSIEIGAVEVKKKANVETSPIESAPAAPEPEPEVVSESVVEEEAPAPAAPMPEKYTTKDWHSFLSFIEDHSKAVRANLEHGNLIGEIENRTNSLQMKVGFKEKASLFFDYFSDKEIFDKLQNYASIFFETDLANTSVKLELVPDETSSDKFESIVDKEIREEEIELKKKEDDMRNNPLLKQAQDMFNTKVDKIKVNK